MNIDLADKLLAKVLNWSKHDVSLYRPIIETLSRIKYDEYQQFSPGMRFTESLATWLKQFEVKDRHILFNLINRKLIFISNKEMNQLVSQVFPDIIRHLIFEKVANELDISPYFVHAISSSDHYKIALRKTLFLGLSDGARTDVLRRFNPFISHEQVLPFYLIPDDKIEGLQKELINDLEILHPEIEIEVKDKFTTLVLLDDFTASGTSYFKFDEIKNEFVGKVKTIINNLKNDKQSKIFELDKLQIIILIYVATEKATKNINDAIGMWNNIYRNNFSRIIFRSVYELSNSISISNDEDEISKILKKYYDNSIETKSYLKGKHDFPWLGFDECGLVLVLNHNTPNNSLPILWNENNPHNSTQLIGLFPRVSRHKK